MYSRKTI